MLLLCGCSSSLEKEYISVTDYDSSDNLATEPEISAIDTYSALTTALGTMISQHQESAQLQFNNYAGSISDDLAEACWQVKSDDALGAYMVDYISYDISRIVTYYQATVYINYTRSAEALESIKNIGANKISETVIDAVSGAQQYITMQMHTSVEESSAMAIRVENALLQAPELIPVIPDITVNVFSGSSLQRIFEVFFDYRTTPEEALKMQEELKAAIAKSSSTIDADNDFSVSILAAHALGSACRYDINAQQGTAYDVLCRGVGDSRAIAMAYSAICKDKGIESSVVTGLKNNEQYYWNIVKVDDFWYHADVVEAMTLPADVVFLRNDTEMIRDFRWDELDYPACEGASVLDFGEEPENQDDGPSIEENQN